MTDLGKRRPVVTQADRDWALAQCPTWAVRDPYYATRPPAWAGDAFGDDPNDWPVQSARPSDPGPAVWDRFVDEQAEAFEAHFLDRYDTHAAWSKLWRKTWWPKADPRRRFPIAGRGGSKPTWSIVRGPGPAFEHALSLCNGVERRIFAGLGFVRFEHDDARSQRVAEKLGVAA